MTRRRLLPTVEIASKLQMHIATTVHVTPDGAQAKAPAGELTCHDGTTVSIQAGLAWRSTPAANYGPWQTVFMETLAPPTVEMAKYATQPTVGGRPQYFGVPLHVAAHFLLVHGGSDFGVVACTHPPTEGTAAALRDSAARFVTGAQTKSITGVRVEHTKDKAASTRKLLITVEYRCGAETSGPVIVTPHEWKKALTTAATNHQGDEPCQE